MKKLFTLGLMMVILAGCVQYKDGKPVNAPEPEKEVEKSEEPVEKDSSQESSEWDDMKNKEKIVGKSNKDFKELTKSKPGKVQNDKTGNWKKITISESADVTEYLLSYGDLYMKDNDTHFIVNFTNKTTTVVNKMTGLIFADVHEYVSKEEHDASVLGSGILLKSYTIYPDGDIEETE